MDQNASFSYTYSAAQQKEVEDIRKKYLPPKEDKMEQLRALHRIPTRRAHAVSITVGILGALVMGTGMSLAMSPLGEGMGKLAMLIGIIIGILGMILMALAYPVYNRVLRKARQRIAPQILHLTDELLK